MYPWLVLYLTTSKAFVTHAGCVTKEGFSLHVKNPDTVFVHTGFNNWKKAHERFKQHAQSSTHREAVVHVKQINLPAIDTQLSRQCHEAQVMHRRVLRVLMSSLWYLLRQGLAVRGGILKRRGI